MRAFVFLFVVLAIMFGVAFIVQNQNTRPTNSDRKANVSTRVVRIELTGDTMGGNEAVASNEIMTVRVRGLYQEMFSGEWHMGIKIEPLRALTVSRITCDSFTGTGAHLRTFTNTFHPPAGQFSPHVEREMNIPFVHPTASMSMAFFDQQGREISRCEITHIVDFMIGHRLLGAANREVYESAGGAVD